MPLSDYSAKILSLARTLYHWLGYLGDLDPERRERVAKYADDIAQTLMRAQAALTRLNSAPKDRKSRNDAIRELARINGYVETIVEVLNHRLDGRKLAGVKRRLERIGKRIVAPANADPGHNTRLDRLSEAEGYFRALADGLRT